MGPKRARVWGMADDYPSRICRHHFFTTLRFTRFALWMYLRSARRFNDVRKAVCSGLAEHAAFSGRAHCFSVPEVIISVMNPICEVRKCVRKNYAVR